MAIRNKLLPTAIVALGLCAFKVAAQEPQPEVAVDLTTGEDTKVLPSIALREITPMSLLSADAIRMGDEGQAMAAYLRLLKQRIAQRPNWIAEELGIGLAELRVIEDLLVRIEDEDGRLTAQRIAAMCEYWRNTAESLSKLERAELALKEYSRLESSELYSNRFRQNFFYDASNALTPELAALIRSQLQDFGKNYQAKYYSWEGIVQSVGIPVEQVNFNCR